MPGLPLNCPPDLDRVEPLTTTCGNPDHAVEFYEHESALVRTVGQHLLAGLAAQANTLVIATPEHLAAVSAYLAKAGLNVGTLSKAGRYVSLNAVELLPKLLEDGIPSAKLFERHVGLEVARLTAGERPLYAFGELVALLTAQGKADSAIQLEALWNSLAERFSFRLLCAYSMKDFAVASASSPFLHICQAHTRVLPTEEIVVSDAPNDEPLRTIAILQQKAAAFETEVAARRRADQTLRRREAELSQLVEATALALHWIDENGKILWANRADMKLLGYSADEYFGRNIAEFHVDPQIVGELLSSVRRREKVENRECRLRCKDGTIKTVLIDCSGVWQDGEFVHTQCFTRDITEQRDAELASRHLAAIVEGSDDAILSKNLDGVVQSWNKGAERIFGYAADEVVGKSVTILIPPDRLGEETEILARLRQGRRVEHYETLRRCKDGTLLNVSLTISPVRDAHARSLAAGVHPRIRPPRSEHRHRCPAQPCEGVLQLALHRAYIRLPLPSREPDSIVMQDKLMHAFAHEGKLPAARNPSNVARP